jgi:sirohydrochlorin cobaltochelatase
MKTKWKRLLVTSLACTALLGVSATTSAAYMLNSAVKDATPALKEAAQIGVLKNENPDMVNLENKDAILIMSFGTTFKDSREATIDATVKQIQAAHPDTKVIISFTSHIIIDRIEKKEGIRIPTPEEALAQLKEEGYTRVALTSFDIMPGMEYSYSKAIFNEYKDQFKKMTLGTSLMYWMGQEGQRDDIIDAVNALKTQFPKLGKQDAVLVMAHGTPHPSNAYYSVIQNRIDQLGLKNVYVYTVEGWPSLETIMPELKAKGIKNVTLMPMMMVAGDHANNDMAGADKDSHKSILEANGFKVSTYIHGLGENPAIRAMFVDRANEAWNALEAQK